jgi:hypothetical protein
MPRKTFTAGEVLAAADVNTFLMDQSVMTFADSGARGSAIGTAIAQEGMLTYLEDTDAFEYWDGSAFTAFGGGGGAATNAIINGAFEINQRGFTSSTADAVVGFDMWKFAVSSGATYSSQAFTPGIASTLGEEAKNHARIVTTGQSGTGVVSILVQRIEDVRQLAEKQITVSFYAKSASGTPSISIEIGQNFGTGGSPSTQVNAAAVQKITLTGSTSWTRYSATLSVPSISGKTIGTTENTSFTSLQFWVSAGSDFNSRTDSLGIQSNTFDIWGVQLEAGSTATPFRRNANSLQGELAACQRYFYNHVFGPTKNIGVGYMETSTAVGTSAKFPVTMRVEPTLIVSTGTNFYTFFRNGSQDDFNSFTMGASGVNQAAIFNNSEISGTAGQSGHVYTINASSSISFSAEL